GRYARRQNEFNFPLGRVHAQRDPPRARADADGYAAPEVIYRGNLPPVIPNTQCLIQSSTTASLTSQREIERSVRETLVQSWKRVLSCPLQGGTRAESGRSTSVLPRALAIEEMDERSEDGSLPQTVGAEIFICRSKR